MEQTILTMYDRTSIRKYQARPVVREVIEKILQAGVQAP